MDNKKTQIQLENKKLINYIFDSDFFPIEKNQNRMSISPHPYEFIIRPECNQKCEYCYIYKHGNELYKNHLSKNEIIHNFDLFLNFLFIQKKCFSRDIEFFAGDMFEDDLFFDLLDILKKYFNIIKEKYSYIFDNESIIVIPCNLSFVYYHPEKADRFLSEQKLFREKYNVRLMFSWSSDGLYATKSREKKELSQEYFDKILQFCVDSECGAHPMVSPENVDIWCENYDWWIENWVKFHPDAYEKGDFQQMILEVRNDGWTEEKIELYLNFLNHVFEKRFELCNKDKEQLAYHLFIGDGKNNTLKRLENYDIIKLDQSAPNLHCEKTSCAMQDVIHFNCNNMSLVICHRLAYKHFTPIYFITNEDNNKIIDFETGNIDIFLALRYIKDQNLPICYDCDYNEVCLKGCFGSQFESSHEVFLPINSVCNLFKAKADFLLKKYNEYDLIKIAYQNNYLNLDYDSHKYLLQKSIEKGYLQNE